MKPLAAILLIAAAFLAGCQTAPYRWGAAEDPDWSGRVGVARYADVIAVLGQPREEMQLGEGETKVRWGGEALTINTDPGSPYEFSEQTIERRTLWRDMRFSREGILMAAWRSDQRALADSQAP